MYAVINLPGSSHFEYYGPDTRAKCEAWLTARVTHLQLTELVTSLVPQRLLSNKEVERWRYRDGTHVVTGCLDTTEPCCGVPQGQPHRQGCPR